MTATAPTQSAKPLRASHRRVMQLFRTFGPSTDAELYEAAKAEGWQISPSGLRSRRSEISPPRGAGLRDSGQRRVTHFAISGRLSRKVIIWEIDPTVTEPYAGRA
jgi:hypothetical protein